MQCDGGVFKGGISHPPPVVEGERVYEAAMLNVSRRDVEAQRLKKRKMASHRGTKDTKGEIVWSARWVQAQPLKIDNARSA